MNELNHEYESYIEQPSTVPEHPMMIVDAGGIDGFGIWIAAMILKMSIVLAFALTTWVSLRGLDWLNGNGLFKKWLNSADENQKTIYYSVRFAAVVIGSAIVFAFGGGL